MADWAARRRSRSLAGAVSRGARAQKAAALGTAVPARPAGPEERKSLQPMATSLGLSGHDQLQHFIASPAWDDAPLWRVLAEQADRLGRLCKRRTFRSCSPY